MNVHDWFLKAQTEGWAIGAFNVDNLDIFKAICEAGRRRKSPVMLEFSQGEVGYFGLENIVDLVENVRKEYGIPILLNLDHAKKVEDCMRAIEVSYLDSSHPGVATTTIGSQDSIASLQNDKKGKETNDKGAAGFDDVHFDGSELSFEENIENTKKVVETAHAKGILVEGEIDKIAGASTVHEEEIDPEALKKSYTDPAKAAEFVTKTGVDVFAPVFGNVHGTFPNQPDLDLELLAKIREALPNTFLSLHGGSGIGAEQVKEAIHVGKIVKINVNTEIRQAFRDALGEELGENPGESAYYKLTPDIVTAVIAVVEAKIEVFGSGSKV